MDAAIYIPRIRTARHPAEGLGLLRVLYTIAYLASIYIGVATFYSIGSVSGFNTGRVTVVNVLVNDITLLLIQVVDEHFSERLMTPQSCVNRETQSRRRGFHSFAGGGRLNAVSGDYASVSGGSNNTASGYASSVSGGLDRSADEELDWSARDLFEDN